MDPTKSASIKGSPVAAAWALLVTVATGCVDPDGTDDSPGGGGIGATCSEFSDSCTGETICLAGSCVAAFPRAYSISELQISVPTTMPDGSPWDLGGGAPDLFLAAYVNNQAAAVTPTAFDRFSASFAGPYTLTLGAGSSLLIQAFDEDLTINDPAYGCVASPLTAALLRERILGCSSAGNTLSFRISPR